MKCHLVSTLFGSCPDPQNPQGAKRRRPPFDLYHPGINRWLDSLTAIRQPAFTATVLHDQEADAARWERLRKSADYRRIDFPAGASPYDFRWEALDRYLSPWPEDDLVFSTDLTDVIVLHDPFAGAQSLDVDGVIFVNDEPAGLRDKPWLTSKLPRHLRLPGLADFFDQNLPTLNAGVIGAQAGMLRQVCGRMQEGFARCAPDRLPSDTDMLVFNWAVRTLEAAGAARIVHGHPVNTPFRAGGASDRPGAWFAHK